MLIRAQFTCLRRTSQKSQSAVCILSLPHKQCRQPVPLRDVCAQVRSNFGSAGPPNAAGMPDPWASSPSFSNSVLPAGDDSSSAIMEPLTLLDSAAISAPPGPWDGADAVSTVSTNQHCKHVFKRMMISSNRYVVHGIPRFYFQFSSHIGSLP